MKENCDITLLENGLKIYQLKEGFRFSVDPVILVDFFEGNPKGKILDIGSGCGIIPILLAEKKGMENIFGVEIQKSSAEIFEKNILENNLSDKITVLNCDVKDLDFGNTFDYIISNPPYMAVDGKKISENENKKIARHEICLDLKKLIEKKIGLEVNTSGIRYGVGDFHPCREIIARYKELGGKIITMGSDAHRALDIMRDFDKAREVLKEIGFEKFCVFEQRKAEYKEL